MCSVADGASLQGRLATLLVHAELDPGSPVPRDERLLVFDQRLLELLVCETLEVLPTLLLHRDEFLIDLCPLYRFVPHVAGRCCGCHLLAAGGPLMGD